MKSIIIVLIVIAGSLHPGPVPRDGKITSHEFRSNALKAPEDKYYIGLNKLADELDIYIIAGVSELDGGRVYNSAMVIGPEGKVNGTYRKNVLWGFEKDRYTPGNGFPTFKTRYGSIGIMICFERQKPKIAKELKKNGAQVIFCLSGGGFGNSSDRIMMQRSRESGLPIVFVHPAEFLVTGPDGTILSRYLFGHQLDDNTMTTLGGVVGIYQLMLTNDK